RTPAETQPSIAASENESDCHRFDALCSSVACNMERRIAKRCRSVVVCHDHELCDDGRRYSFCTAPAPPLDAELGVSGHLGSLTGWLQHLSGSCLSIRRIGTGLPDCQG